MPNITTSVASPLPPLYEYHVFLEEGKSWEAPVTFSFSGVSFAENQCLVEDCRVNDLSSSVDKVAIRDAGNNGYFFQLFAELWIYNVKSRDFQFHNRYVQFWLNMSS